MQIKQFITITITTTTTTTNNNNNRNTFFLVCGFVRLIRYLKFAGKLI